MTLQKKNLLFLKIYLHKCILFRILLKKEDIFLKSIGSRVLFSSIFIFCHFSKKSSNFSMNESNFDGYDLPKITYFILKYASFLSLASFSYLENDPDEKGTLF